MNNEPRQLVKTGSAGSSFDGTTDYARAETIRPDGPVGAEILRLDRVIADLGHDLVEHQVLIAPILSDVGVMMDAPLMMPPEGRQPATCQLEARLRECADQIARLALHARELSARVRL